MTNNFFRHRAKSTVSVISDLRKRKATDARVDGDSLHAVTLRRPIWCTLFRPCLRDGRWDERERERHDLTTCVLRNDINWIGRDEHGRSLVRSHTRPTDRKILGTRPPYKRGSERVNENKKDVRLSRRRKLRIKLGSRQLMSLRRERYTKIDRERKRERYISVHVHICRTIPRRLSSLFSFSAREKRRSI